MSRFKHGEGYCVPTDWYIEVNEDLERSEMKVERMQDVVKDISAALEGWIGRRFGHDEFRRLKELIDKLG